VKLSLGSAEGLDGKRVRSLAALASQLGAHVVSEHLSFTRAGPAAHGVEIGHLTALPRTSAAVETLAHNARTVKAALPVPFLVENVAWTFRWPEDELTEEQFITAVVRNSGCGLLLDVGNLRANARNEGRDPFRVLEGYPLDAVAMVHVAGSVAEHGFVLDTHAHPVASETLSLLQHLFGLIGPRPVLLERDHDFPPFSDLAAELNTIRQLVEAAPARPVVPSSVVTELHGGGAPDLAARQREIASALTSVVAPADHAGLDAAELTRARAILFRKRLDEALPLLPNLSALGMPVRDLGMVTLTRMARARRAVALADAFALAGVCRTHGPLAAAAERDLLALRARFAGPDADGTFRPRRMPFIGTLPGAALWAVKGPGAQSRVYTMEKP